MAIYRGLNVNLSLSDVLDNEETLNNLGLNKGDLDVISGANTDDGNGLSVEINSNELQTLSGLVTDQRKQLYSIAKSSGEVEGELERVNSISFPLQHNIRIDNQLRAGAFKYKYYNYADNSITGADISTSRVSSWSTSDPTQADAPIFYGGDIEVLPNNGNSVLTAQGLQSVQPPIQRLPYDSITPTHLITLSVNGVERQFYAIKGIPLRFDAFFRNANSTSYANEDESDRRGLYYKVDSSFPGDPVWRIINKDTNNVFDSTTRNLNSTIDGYRFFDSRNRPRTVEFYYNPNGILHLGVPNINISQLPNVILENLRYYNLQNNDLYEMPDFSTLTPALLVLILSGNNLSRATDDSGNLIPANDQLQKLPSTLETLYINGSFRDDQSIDISTTCPNLTHFYMDARYGRNSYRSMTDTGPTPGVPSNSIKLYRVRRHPYRSLSDTIVNSTTLETLNIYNCNIIGAEDGADNDTFITLASNELRSITSHSNSHNLISVQGKSNITSYRHTSSRGLNGGDSAINDINNVFDNTNSALQTINLSYTDAYGAIDSAFADLQSLRAINLRYTRLSGSLNDLSFENTDSLSYINIRGGRFNSNDFFGVDGSSNRTGLVFSNLTALSRLYVIDNRNISGDLPVFDNNAALRVIVVRNTGISGSIPEFSGNDSLSTIILNSNNFTGSIPAFSGPNFRRIEIANNQLSGQIPRLQCSNLTRLRIDNNNITGSFADLSGCPAIAYVSANNNQITSYASGSLSSNLSIRVVDLSSNSLQTSDVNRLLMDLKTNFDANPRSGVVINLLNNEIGNLSPESQEIFDTLTNIYNWTILI